MSRFHTFGVVLFFVLVTEVVSQGNLNMQFVGQLRTRGTSQYSNCWGYNAPDGKEFAIVGTAGGTQIVDITSDTLKEVAFIPGPQSGWREMKVYQHYAYVVTEGSGAGLQIIDLDSLKLVNTVTSPVVPSGHTVSIEGKYLYINGARYKNGGIVVLDLTDPVNPVYAGEYQAEYVHDCIIKNDTIYAAAIYGEGLDIIDATNKADMKRINLVNYPYAGTHNTDVTADGKYVLTTDEINSDPGQNGNIVRVWDKSDINNVKLVGSYVAAQKTIAHNIHIKGNYGYVAHYTEGVRVIDLKDPEIPVEVAYYDTFIGSGNTYAGNWGVFPYYNSNKIIATDMQGGLFVVKFPGQAGSLPVARGIITVVDSATNAPIEGVTVEQVGRSLSYMTDAAGKVKFGSLMDTVTLKLTKESFDNEYYSRIVKIQMPFNATGEMTLKLQKLPVGGLTVTVSRENVGDHVQGAKVQIRETPVSGFTNAEGKFSVASLVADRTYRILVSKFGFAIDSIDIQVHTGDTNAVEISLVSNGKDDFVHDLGWTVGSVQDSGTSGRWQRAVPKPIILLGDTMQPPYGHGGSNDPCFVTGASNSLSDNVEGRVSLVSPSFSLIGMSEPSVLYWLFTNTRAVPVDDTLFVEISNDDGATWIQAESISGKRKTWLQHRIDVKSLIAPTATMRLRFVARDGGNTTTFEVSVDDVEFGDNLQLSVPAAGTVRPNRFALRQNFPNPFNPKTTIRFEVPTKGFVSLKVYDMIGRERSVAIAGEYDAGVYEVSFDGSNLSSGVYFYTLHTGSFTETKKMILAK